MNGNALELLSRLRGMGIKLSAENERLRFRAPAGTMTPEIKAEIAQLKPEILRVLHSPDRSHAEGAAPIIAVPRTRALPLSHDEQRLWFLHFALPDQSIYNVASVTRIRGPFEVARFRQALAAVMRRQEILRTGFVEQDGVPVRQITPECDVPIVEDTASPRAGETMEDFARRHVAHETARPFDLASAPLFRVNCLRLGVDDHVVVLTAHHIICDDWSLQLLRREVSVLYETEETLAAGDLPALPIQYADYATWQCQRVAGRGMDRQRAYWRRRLDDAPTALALPFDRPRPQQLTHRGGHRDFTLEQGAADALERLGASAHATPFMAWLAAFAAFLSRISGQHDIIVATPFAGRERPEVQPLIGFFLNTLPIRAKVDPATVFQTHVVQLRTIVLDAFEHGDLPLDSIVAESSVRKNSAATSLFSVMFVFNENQERAWSLPHTTAESFPSGNGTAKMDLTLYLGRRDDGRMHGSFEYTTDLFDPASIDRMVGQFSCLIESISRSPGDPIGRLRLLPEAQRRVVTHAFNQTAATGEVTTVHGLFARQAAATPDGTAVAYQGRVLTYRDLNARADSLATRLRALGVGPDVPVGLCVERSLDLVIAVLGILKAGGCYVPLEPSYPKNRLALMVSDADVKVLLTRREFADRFPEMHDRIAVLDRDEKARAELPSPVQASSVGPRNLAYVIYTSGSTGKPKGVAMIHRALVNLIEWQIRESAESRVGWRTIQFTSLNFDVSFQEIFATLCSGGTLVMMAEELRYDPAALWQYLREQRINRIFLPFVALQQLAEAAGECDELADSLREVVTAGEQLHVTPKLLAMFRRLKHARLHNHYGPSETHVVTAYTLPEDIDAWMPLPPIGRPIANTRCYILDQYREPVPVGVAGELHLGGDGLARGYLNQPGLTAAKFIRDPFTTDDSARLYVTGDRCRWLPDGTIEFLGRLDEQVKLRGYRIELAEIENVLGQHPQVGEAAVTLGDDGNGNKELHAYLVPRKDAEPSLEALRGWISQHLPDYMRPARYATLERLPVNANGKLDRRALLGDANCRVLASAGEHIAPRTPLEAGVAVIWRRVLNRERIGVHENFFEIGGNSLQALRLVHEIQRELGHPLRLPAFFAAPTIESLSLRLQNGTADSLSLLRPGLRGTGEGTPLFYIPNAGGYEVLPPAIARRLEGDRRFSDSVQYQGVDGQASPLDQIEAIAADLVPKIRKIHPTGPYCLSGYCFGGLVAYEVARQLTEAGQTVRAVVLWDAGPWQRSRWRRRSFPDILRRLRQRLVDRPVREPNASRGVLRRLRRRLAGLSVGERLAFLARRATASLRNLKRAVKRRMFGQHEAPRPIPALRDGLSEPEREVIRASYRAIARYQPKPYAGQVLLLRSGSHRPERLFYERLPLDGWDGLLHGHVSVVDFPCEHLELIQEPALSEAAKHIARFLREVDREPQNSRSDAGEPTATEQEVMSLRS